jgi:7,8-dihydropterin-6-yl-methyl-4-(beta-D-ribofuranosyl)aminobenzene 5'-phosphate synthase
LNRRILFTSIIIMIITIVLTYYLQKYLTKPNESLIEEAALKLDECRGSLTIVYDNNPYEPGLGTAWGFSCLISLNGTTILFDTGGDGGLLTQNMAKLGVDINSIRFIVLSHIHGDHTGGLDAVLERNNNVTVYLPATFPSSFKANVERHGSGIVEVQDAMKICDCAVTTGVLGTSIKEQSLIVRTSEGLVIITGCAHPGIVSIVREAKDLTGDEVHLVIGGFHLGSKSTNEITQIISEMIELGVRKVAPVHCSGDTARRLFKEAFGEDYVEAGVGSSIQFGSET